MILSPDDEDGPGSWPLQPLRRELAPVANTALIALELEALREAGIQEIGLAAGDALANAARDAVDRTGMEVDVVHIPPPPEGGLAARLLTAEAFIGANAFVAEIAGSLTRHDLRRSVEVLERKRLAALVILATDWSRTPQVIPLRPSDVSAAPGPEGLARDMFARANAFVFGPEIFDAARIALEAHADEEVGIAHAVEALAEEPGRLLVVTASGWSKRLEGVEDLLELNRLVLQEIGPEAVPETVQGNRIMGPVAIDPTATIESSVLNGPLAIAAGAYITDSYIGPYTAVGAGVRLDGTEIERAVVLPGAWIDDVGARIEGSVVGAGARITREFGLPRTLQLWIGQDARVTLA